MRFGGASTLSGALVLLILLALVIRLPNVTRPILEPYSFRQTQTAFPIRHLAESGRFDLWQTYLPVLGPPWELSFELPLYQNLAGMVARGGATVEAAGRLLSILSCLVSALLFYIFLLRHTERSVAVMTLAIMLFSPFAIFWSTAVLIDFFALALVAVFLVSGDSFLGTGRRSALLVALLAFTFGAMVKLPTVIFYPVLVGAAAFTSEKQLRAGRLLALLAACAMAAVPFLAWTRYTDAVKAASPHTAFAVSYRLHEWYFGSSAQLASWDTVGAVLGRVLENLGLYAAPLWFIAGLLFAVARERERILWLGLALQLALTIGVFRNLHLAHHYYQVAVLPALAAFTALGLTRFVTRLRYPVLVAAVLLAVFALRIERVTQYLTPVYMPEQSPPAYRTLYEIGSFVGSRTAKEETVAIVGLETWDPTILYVADRRGFMVRELSAPGVPETVARYDYLLELKAPLGKVATQKLRALVGASVLYEEPLFIWSELPRTD